MRANEQHHHQHQQHHCGPLRGNHEPSHAGGSEQKPQQLKQMQDQPLHCAIQTTNKLGNQLHDMYRATTLGLRRCAHSRAPARSLQRPSPVAIVLVSALVLLLASSPARAFYWSTPGDGGDSAAAAATSSGGSLASSLLSAIQDANKASNESRPILSTIQDAVSAAVAASAPAAPSPAPVGPAPAAGPASASGGTSIVASLSSAVASAAAAAALAAAQNTLSGGDARSLLTNPQNPNQQQPAGGQQRHRTSSTVQLAMKLAADAMPEVPYNILHNMKKLDHAAPFYNVGAKTNNPGLQFMKEGAGGLLAHTLAASGSNPAGGVGRFEQLSSLLRSPLWKRLADGYGEFASEFRSLFRVPPKASGASAAAAASSSSSTGRLLRDISLPAILVLLASTIPSEQWRPVRTRRKSLPLALELSPAAVTVDPMTASETSLSAVPMFSVAPGYQQQLERQLATINQPHRSGDINLQQQQWLRHYSAPELAQEEQSIRRVGESFGYQVVGKPVVAQQRPTEPVASGAASQHQQQQRGLLGSLTSNLVGGGSKLMNRIMNANGDNHLRAGDDARHRYSLVPAPDHQQQAEQLKSARHLLSAMNQALGHMVSEGSGSARSELPVSSTVALNNNAPIYHLRTGEPLLRRQQPVPAVGGQEQRELSQLIPQSWREVLKRTVSSVQQQASTQWRSIEGQLTNWVQDKLKSLPATTPSQPTPNGAASAPVANIIASVGSTAMNMLGLGGGGATSNGASKPSAPQATVAEQPAPAPDSSNKNNKTDKPNGGKQATVTAQGPKAALAGVANLIVSTLTNRTPTTTKVANESEPSRASQYPTLTGAQLAASSAAAPVAPSSAPTSTTQVDRIQTSSTSSSFSSSPTLAA